MRYHPADREQVLTHDTSPGIEGHVHAQLHRRAAVPGPDVVAVSVHGPDPDGAHSQLADVLVLVATAGPGCARVTARAETTREAVDRAIARLGTLPRTAARPVEDGMVEDWMVENCGRPCLAGRAPGAPRRLDLCPAIRRQVEAG